MMSSLTIGSVTIVGAPRQPCSRPGRRSDAKLSARRSRSPRTETLIRSGVASRIARCETVGQPHAEIRHAQAQETGARASVGRASAAVGQAAEAPSRGVPGTGRRTRAQLERVPRAPLGGCAWLVGWRRGGRAAKTASPWRLSASSSPRHAKTPRHLLGRDGAEGSRRSTPHERRSSRVSWYPRRARYDICDAPLLTAGMRRADVDRPLRRRRLAHSGDPIGTQTPIKAKRLRWQVAR